MKSASVFFLKRTWCTAQLLFNFYTNFIWHIINLKTRDCEMCSTAQKQLINFCTTQPLDYIKREVWSGKVCAEENLLCSVSAVDLCWPENSEHSVEKQSRFTNYLCFFCMWDNKNWTHHCTKKDWPVPFRLRNLKKNPLVDIDRTLFPPLHIKLDLMKEFTKALNKNGSYFTYLCHAFPGLNMKKLKAGIFVGLQYVSLLETKLLKI